MSELVTWRSPTRWLNCHYHIAIQTYSGRVMRHSGTSTCPVDMGAACAATGICLDSDVFLLEELLKLRMGKN